MKVYLREPNPDVVWSLLSKPVVADYVYMYPPRQAYRPIDLPLVDLRQKLHDSLLQRKDLNVYIHVPFCRQICSFCNLFTVGNIPALFEDYITTVVAELGQVGWGREHQINSIYIGGGTPSLLTVPQMARLLSAVVKTLGADVQKVPEVALEVAPDTVEEAKFYEFRCLGINRVNLGFQTTAPQELRGIRRRHGREVLFRTLDTIKLIGFRNVCVDLIYGLKGQTDETWSESLATVIGYRPETICTYCLTLRPHTGYGYAGYRGAGAAALLRRYDIAKEMLEAAGYWQESPVRYIRSSEGGYRQKANHWSCQNVLGLGAGARSYLVEADVRNGYSVVERGAALKAYMKRVADGTGTWDSGFLMSPEERMRKYIILGLLDLALTDFRDSFGQDLFDVFPKELACLEECGLLVRSGDRLRLSDLGRRHRDLLVQLFFSTEVCDRLTKFEYRE